MQIRYVIGVNIVKQTQMHRVKKNTFALISAIGIVIQEIKLILTMSKIVGKV